MREASIKEVIKAISAQSDFSFVYSDADIAKLERKNVSFTNENITKILDYFLASSPLEYEISDNIIIIKKSNDRQPVQQRQQPREKKEVKGVVCNAYGKPVPGASVMFKGTTTGKATDINGTYSLTVPDGGKVMVFSFLGMKSKEVNYTGQSTINVVLEEDVVEASEIVVTGIFNKSRESYTGAVTTITSKELEVFKGQNLISTLKNIDPSINILSDNNAGSNPNSIPQINMRGSSSLPMSVEEFNEGVKQKVNVPLIIMDGFEVSLTKLMDYNDDDIESINILKDASATAIYGSRGANGVIVIITKAPQPGKLKINAQISTNISVPDLSSYNLLNASEKLQLEDMIGLYYSPSNYNQEISKQEYYNSLLKDVLEGVDTYWLSKPLRVGVGQKYNIRLEGGSNEFRWGTTLAYNNIAGAMKGSSRNTFNGGVILSYTYKNVIFRNQTNIGANKSIESNYGTFSDYANMQPYFKPYNEDGSVNRFFDAYYGDIQNPLFDAQLNTKNESKYSEIINNFSIEWNISKEFKARAQFGISNTTNMSDKFLPAEHSTFQTTSYSDTDGFFRRGSYDYGVGENTKYDGNITLSYSNTYKDRHQIYAGLDFSVSQTNSYLYQFSLEGFSNEDLDFLGNALQYAQNATPYGYEDKTRRVGLTTNINYTYDNRFYADLSFRVDGSSQFGTKNKFAPFWSIGTGWNMHREEFLKDNDVINTLRLKLSYGVTGSQQFSAYQALSTFQYYTDNKYINWTGAGLISLGNEELKWQVTDQFNVGSEISLLNNRLSATFDYYIKKTSNLLSSMDIPLSMGFPSYIDNIGEVRNNGFEASISGYIIRNTESNFIWMLSGKLVYNKNKIIKLSEAIKAQTEEYKLQEVDVSSLFYEGYSQNSIYAVRSLGIDPSTGNEIFLDKDGNITDTWNPSAKVYMGVNEPLYRGNLSSRLTYRDLTLTLSFAYHWGGKLYNQTLIDKVEVSTSVIANQNVDSRVLNERWSTPGDNTFFKGFDNTSETHATSRFVMNDRTFELQTVSLQYRWNSDFFKKANIQSVILGVNMSDVFYLSSVKRERGISYPFARTIGATLSLIF
jgi:TonB-linked SusC/RagA family outer membrane protein